MCLFSFGQNVDESAEVGGTSASQKFQQFPIAVLWLSNVDKMLPLRSRKTSDYIN